MCLLAAAGVGVGAALGVGGRDLSAEVGGLSTREALRRLDADPSVERIVLVSKPPAPEVAAALEEYAAGLATPVDLEAVKKHLKAKPAIPGLTRGALDSDGTTYQVTVNFEVQTAYHISVEAGLTDVFGQKLAKAVSHDFHTGDARR